MLDEDGVTGQVTVGDGRVAGMEVTGDTTQGQPWLQHQWLSVYWDTKTSSMLLQSGHIIRYYG